MILSAIKTALLPFITLPAIDMISATRKKDEEVHEMDHSLIYFITIKLFKIVFVIVLLGVQLILGPCI